jgi:cyclopropane-fatty-acyl-phospholipid synthase
MGNDEKKTFARLMQYAGITINGDRPFDPRIYNDGFYRRVLTQQNLGLGESYMEKWWDCTALDQFITKILQTNLREHLKKDWAMALQVLKAAAFNLQRPGRAFRVGEIHYDIGNDLYERMLDKRMQYSCGYYKDTDTLEEAQRAKLDLICRKLDLEPGMEVIELGCGFGGFARFAAENYGVKVTGYTVSKEQAKFARQYCKDLPITIHLEDYRKATGSFDRVVSIGLMEHVGCKNYRTYMKLANQLVKADGIVFIHTIGANVSNITCNPWTTKYIFPNGMLPSMAQLSKAMEGLFVMEDWHNFGEDYDKTLMAWHDNFVRTWPELKQNYSDAFYRMWKYYLLSSAGGFRARSMQVWQMVLTKPGRSCPDTRIS